MSDCRGTDRHGFVTPPAAASLAGGMDRENGLSGLLTACRPRWTLAQGVRPELCLAPVRNFPASTRMHFILPTGAMGSFMRCTWNLAARHLVRRSNRFVRQRRCLVTDLVINPVDGAMYFLIGGRRIQSGLYRVKYVGAESTMASDYPAVTATAKLRQKLENPGTPLAELWSGLAHSDRFVRYAARTSLEKIPLSDWVQKIVSEPDAQTCLEAVMALARVGKPEHQPLAVQTLKRLDWDALDEFQQLQLLRNYGLIMMRLGEPNESTINTIHELAQYFPSHSTPLNWELARVLAASECSESIPAIVDLLVRSETQEDQIHLAMVLHHVREGWDLESRKKYFNWFLDAAKFQGGNSFTPYIANIRKAAVETLTDTERDTLKEVLAKKPETKDPYADLKARPFVQKWTVDELMPIAEQQLAERDLQNGKTMFAIGQCFKCHRIAGEGGIVGPDLTNAGRRFNVRDLLETLIDPSKEISDQYRATVFQMDDGRTIVGRIVNHVGDQYMVQQDMINPGALNRVNINDIEGMKPSSVSMMPTGLLDNFTRDEILDMLAFMRSTSTNQ